MTNKNEHPLTTFVIKRPPKPGEEFTVIYSEVGKPVEDGLRWSFVPVPGIYVPDPPDEPDEPVDPPPDDPPPPPPPAETGRELLIFDWNKPVTTKNRGFPYDQPPRANGDWTKPVNYAEGTVHFRAEIRKMPTNKTVRLQLCHWQNEGSNNFGLETCGGLNRISYDGKPVVAEWSTEVGKMWKLDNKPLDWTRPRFRVGVAIKNAAGQPVSDYNGWNWNGENPAEWYPLDMRFTAVVVEKGKAFGGWDKYIK